MAGVQGGVLHIIELKEVVLCYSDMETVHFKTRRHHVCLPASVQGICEKLFLMGNSSVFSDKPPVIRIHQCPQTSYQSVPVTLNLVNVREIS